MSPKDIPVVSPIADPRRPSRGPVVHKAAPPPGQPRTSRSAQCKDEQKATIPPIWYV